MPGSTIIMPNFSNHASFVAALTFLVIYVAGMSQSQARDTGDGYRLEEIVVTARKIEERIQDTPVSVTAVTAEMFDERGAEQISAVADIAPNVNFSFGGAVSGSGSAAVAFIRGVGQNDFTHNTDPGVGIYVDGVYLGRTVGSVLDILDLERVEVIRGPQGTLFGRNTIRRRHQPAYQSAHRRVGRAAARHRRRRRQARILRHRQWSDLGKYRCYRKRYVPKKGRYCQKSPGRRRPGR